MARRLGASSVKLLYRRDREAMPAWDHELQMALEEGVELVTLLLQVQVVVVVLDTVEVDLMAEVLMVKAVQ